MIDDRYFSMGALGRTLSLLAFVLCATSVVAEVPDLIIRNVQVELPGDGSGVRSVDIQILKGRVAHVSDDRIHADEGTRVEDADEGHLLGKLEIGLAPNFIIVDDNPLDNFEVLRNTLAHTTFSVDGDQILIDKLSASTERAPPDLITETWTSHNPPPVVLDDTYSFDEKWNAFESSHVTGLFSAGLFLDRTNWISQNSASRDQVGDIGTYDGGTIRAFRFGLNGTLKFARPWTYSFWVATNSFDSEFNPDESDDFNWFDYRLDIPVTDHVTVGIGKQKEPISLARLMTLTWNPMQERAATQNAMMASRNIGVTLSGRAFDERVTWAGGVYNNWIDSGESFSDNAKQYTGRVTWLPLLSEDGSHLVHLGLSVRYDEATQGLHYNAVPEVREAPLFVDTGLFDADSATLFNLEAGWRKGPVWIMGEFTRNNVNAPDFGDPTFTGYNIFGSWTVTGETRPYRRRSGVFGPLPVARDVDHGGHGAVELAVRWSEIDLSSGGINGGEMQVAKAAATWWATTSFNVSLNYQWIWNEIDGSEGRADGFVFRIMVFTK